MTFQELTEAIGQAFEQWQALAQCDWANDDGAETRGCAMMRSARLFWRRHGKRRRKKMSKMRTYLVDADVVLFTPGGDVRVTNLNGLFDAATAHEATELVHTALVNRCGDEFEANGWSVQVNSIQFVECRKKTVPSGAMEGSE